MRVCSNELAMIGRFSNSTTRRGRCYAASVRFNCCSQKPKLVRAALKKNHGSNVDTDLFESLRSLRRELAAERGVPAYLLFSDATLRDMALAKPGSAAALLSIRGVGERKLADLGQRFLEVIAKHGRENRLPLDVS